MSRKQGVQQIRTLHGFEQRLAATSLLHLSLRQPIPTWTPSLQTLPCSRSYGDSLLGSVKGTSSLDTELQKFWNVASGPGQNRTPRPSQREQSRHGRFLEEEVHLLKTSTVYFVHICWGSQDPLLSEQEASGSSQETTGDIPVDAARRGAEKGTFFSGFRKDTGSAKKVPGHSFVT